MIDLFMIVVQALSQTFSVAGFGALAALFPFSFSLFDVICVHRIGRLVNLIFLPAFIFSNMGSTFSASLLLKYSPLLFVDSSIRFLSWMTFSASKRLLPLDPSTLKAVRLGILFPNSCSLPLLVMKSLCTLSTFNADFDGKTSECIATANTMILVQFITWPIWFFSWGFSQLSLANELCMNNVSSCKCKGQHKSFTERSICASNSNMYTCVEGNKGLSQTRHEQVPLLWASNSGNEIRWIPLKKLLKDAVQSPSILAVIFGIGVALVEPLKKGLFYDPASPLRPFGAAVVAISISFPVLNILVMAASFAQPCEQAREHSIDTENLLRCREKRHNWKRTVSICVFTLCPLILVPFVGFGAFILIEKYISTFKQNCLMRFIILLQLGMPATPTIIVSLTQLKFQEMAASMTPMYLFQYAFSVVTLTCLAACARWYVY